MPRPHSFDLQRWAVVSCISWQIIDHMPCSLAMQLTNHSVLHLKAPEKASKRAPPQRTVWLIISLFPQREFCHSGSTDANHKITDGCFPLFCFSILVLCIVTLSLLTMTLQYNRAIINVCDTGLSYCDEPKHQLWKMQCKPYFVSYCQSVSQWFCLSPHFHYLLALFGWI